jgi:hypothetical protein
MKTENDLIQEITQLTDRNAPVAFLIETTKDLARKRFSGNKAVARMVEVLVSYDPIYNLATKDKATMLASGVIKKEDIIRSLYAYKVMISIVAQNGTQFLESPLNVIFEALDQAMLPIIENYENEPIVDLGIANGAENEDEINRDVDSSDIGMS